MFITVPPLMLAGVLLMHPNDGAIATGQIAAAVPM